MHLLAIPKHGTQCTVRKKNYTQEIRSYLRDRERLRLILLLLFGEASTSLLIYRIIFFIQCHHMSVMDFVVSLAVVAEV
jgi:hypothetical protein